MWFGCWHYQHSILWTIQDLHMGLDDQDFIWIAGTCLIRFASLEY